MLTVPARTTSLWLNVAAANEQGSRLIRSYHRTATECVTIVVISALVAAWTRFPSLPSLWTTPYGWALIRKTIAVAGSAGIGLFFAFWSWVGFESTAMYGEESRNPKRIIPLATMLSVLGIGIFYVIISWSAIVGTGSSQLRMPSSSSGRMSWRAVARE